MSLSTEHMGLVAAAGLGLVALYTLNRTLTRKDLPGPPVYPIIGSLHLWPKTDLWFTFTKWRETYGDLVFVTVAGKKFLVLNSPDEAKAILDDRGAVYSDRPTRELAHNIIGWAKSPIMRKASHPHFKAGRRFMLNAVGSKAALGNYIRMENHEVHRLLRRIVDEPDRLEYYLRKLTGTIILRIVYGYDVKPGRDEYVDLIEQVNTDLNDIGPGKFMVDIIPALAYFPDWFPGASWKRIVHRMKANLALALHKPVEYVKSQLAAGTAQQSVVSAELQSSTFNEERDGEMLAWTAEALYTGGADTSYSVLHSFFLCMTLFPEAQAKAQEEVDRVLGCDALANWDDRARLPYVDAMIAELIRWAPVAPLAVPHCAQEDGEYKGHLIAKGTTIFANIWGFTRDPKEYKDPDTFNPDRFLGPNPERDPRGYAFGFGRRKCPGQPLAETTIFLVIANALQTLEIGKKTGENGEVITPKGDYVGVTVRHPAPFECKIKCRSSRTEDLIRAVDDAPYGHQ